MAQAPVTERTGFGWSKAEVAAPDAEAEYRTFPRKTAPILLAAGGTLTFIGALGAWIRAVEVTSQSQSPRAVGTMWGFSQPTGRGIAILAAMAVFIAVAGYFTAFLPRLAVEGTALVLFGVLLARLITLTSVSSALAAAAKQNPTFVSYNAGFGWGAWLMVLGLVLAFLGLLVGGLRELDLHRGLPE